jgi:hypothetical protein
VISPIRLKQTPKELCVYCHFFTSDLKNIGSVFFLKNGLKKFAEKHKNHFRSNNHEVCTAAAHCITNILDVMDLKKKSAMATTIFMLFPLSFSLQ